MRFEVSYASGTTHEVELSASLAVLGRDPGCDIVLNDTKCSRRHATIEDGPEGLLLRDTGSANGIHVNGKRVQSAPLRPGDSIRLGDVTLTLLPEVGETVVVAPFDLDLHAEPAPPPPARPAAPARPVSAPPGPEAPRADARRRTVRDLPAASAPPPSARPLTVSVLAGLWALFVPTAIALTLLGVGRLGGGWLGWTVGAVASIVLAGLGTTMAFGLLARAPWARHLQIATACLGLLLCPFSLASATVLLYMARPEVKDCFDPTAGRSATPAGAEPTFALSLVAMLVLGLALTAIAALLLRPLA